jgi:hypothetical protein
VLDFTCSECGKLLGKIRRDASSKELAALHRSLLNQGYTPVHHFGWFCSRPCGEAFFRRQGEGFHEHPPGSFHDA